jgi:hypothetical protein
MTKTIELQELNKWKVGQTVVVYRPGNSNEELNKVTRITNGRNGTIYIKDMAFDLVGRERGNQDIWHRKSINPATAGDIARIKTANRRSVVCAYQWKDLRDDQIISVFKLIQSFEKAKNEGAPFIL